MMHDSFGNPLFRPAWAEIDLAALRHNYEVLSRVIPSGVKIMAMVKADAYGHGAVQVARALKQCGVRALGVATVEEGIELRQAGIDTQILVMTGLMGIGTPACERMIEASLTPVVHSHGVLAPLEAAAARASKQVKIHVKIDTGMNRLGVRPESLSLVLEGLASSPHLVVEGVMTHMADAAWEESFEEQMDCFREVQGVIEEALGTIPVWHAANSIATVTARDYCPHGAHECWVRPGLALYGEVEVDHPVRAELRPVMSLHSRIMLLKRVPEGSRVSYGGTYVTKRPSRLAVIPIGYADGYPWAASNKGQVLVRGKRVGIAGRVTMDMIVLDVTDLDDVAIGDDVTLLGPQGEESITLAELAQWSNTIPYVVLCGISKRMPRIYREQATV